MFTERLKKWIIQNVQNVYPGDVEQDICAFEKGLMLKATEENLDGINEILPDVLEEMSGASLDGLLANMERFMKVEQYFRHLFSLFFPERYSKPPYPDSMGLNAGEWTFAPLLKQAFGVVPEAYNLKSGKPILEFPNRDAYFLVYNSRNMNAHDFAVMGQKKALALIEACLCIYLDISGRMNAQIQMEYDKEEISEGFSARQYCKNIVNNHKRRNKAGFNYIDIKWKMSGTGSAELSTVNSILQNSMSRQVKC